MFGVSVFGENHSRCGPFSNFIVECQDEQFGTISMCSRLLTKNIQSIYDLLLGVIACFCL